MKNKRFVAIIMAMLTFVCSLTGCTSGKNESDPTVFNKTVEMVYLEAEQDVPIVYIPVEEVPEESPFPDVSTDSWAYKAIVSAVDRGYISPYPDGTFNPYGEVTHGEFYEMLCKALDMEVMHYEGDHHWAYDYAQTLYLQDKIAVKTKDSFLDAPTMRKEAVRSLLISCGVNGGVLAKFYAEEDIPFTDMPFCVNGQLAWDGYIINAYQNGIISGYSDGTVRPEENITRAEAVVLIERALEVEDWSFPSPEAFKNIPIQFKGNIAETYRNEVCVALQCFPEYVIQKYISHGGRITITDEDYTMYHDPGFPISGMYVNDTHEIVIFTNGEPASAQSNVHFSLVHELGHYMHDRIISAKDSDTLISIFEEGTEPDELAINLDRDYCKSSAPEYIADLIRFIATDRYNIVPNGMDESIAIVQPYFDELV